MHLVSAELHAVAEYRYPLVKAWRPCACDRFGAQCGFAAAESHGGARCFVYRCARDARRQRRDAQRVPSCDAREHKVVCLHAGLECIRHPRACGAAGGACAYIRRGNLRGRGAVRRGDSHSCGTRRHRLPLLRGTQGVIRSDGHGYAHYEKRRKAGKPDTGRHGYARVRAGPAAGNAGVP